jgi:hypothetical protein
MLMFGGAAPPTALGFFALTAWLILIIGKGAVEPDVQEQP